MNMRDILSTSMGEELPCDVEVFRMGEEVADVSFPVSKEAQDKDFVIEFDKAKVMMPGTNVTVVAFSRTVGEALMPLLKRERTPNDQPHCFHQKGWGQSGIGFEIVGIIMEMEAFDYLDNNPLSA
ncbi:hypothetical protein L915_18886 [Phytophthora nicotianae]|uniref:Pyruvate dehydrogenase E1 component subunit beta n=1 Tax=Phytophthora nicotianae TaxID=4792 RepID=W2FTY1_PHYNI|nr:hypothetical protein L915_18886 [Phytophthora nicotianae]